MATNGHRPPELICYDTYLESWMHPPISQLSRGNKYARILGVRDLEDQLIAIGSFDIFPDQLSVQLLFVHRSHRGRGIATQMIQTMEYLAKKEGRRRSSLTSRPLTDDALSQEQLNAWYQKIGYQLKCEESSSFEKAL